MQPTNAFLDGDDPILIENILFGEKKVKEVPWDCQRVDSRGFSSVQPC